MDLTINPIKGPTILRGIILSLVFLIIWELSAKLFIPAIAPSLSKNALILISRLLFWLYVLAVWLYAFKVEGQYLLLWSEKEYNIGTGILSVLLVLLGVIAGSAVINTGIKLLHLTSSGAVIKTFANIPGSLKLFTVITAAVGEELIFRGYLMPRLQLYFKNIWAPIVISALLFGLAHASYGTVSNTLGPLYIGLVFGWYYQKYRNIKVLMICHFIIDFVALFLAHQ
jgi:membrane protease YdiL (CAAX protease family)